MIFCQRFLPAYGNMGAFNGNAKHILPKIPITNVKDRILCHASQWALNAMDSLLVCVDFYR